MPGALYSLPSANVAPDATPTWSTGTPDTDYPLANVLTLEPDVPAKANENTASLRLTWGGAKTLKALALINLNCPGVTIQLSNNGGMVAQTFLVPDPEDGLCINAWFDLRDVSSNSGTQWTIAIVGSAPVAIGTVVALESFEELRNRWDYRIRDRFPVIEHRTSLGKRLQYRTGTRTRLFSGDALLAEDRNAMRTLRREANGSLTPFVLIPDEEDADDVLLVQFAGPDSDEVYRFHAGSFSAATVEGIVDQPLDLEEVNAGVAL